MQKIDENHQAKEVTSLLSRISEKLQIQVRYFDELMNCAKKIESLGLRHTRDDIRSHEETLTEYERKIKQLHAKIILKEEQIEKMRQDMIKSETKRAALTAQLAKTKQPTKKQSLHQITIWFLAPVSFYNDSPIRLCLRGPHFFCAKE